MMWSIVSEKQTIGKDTILVDMGKVYLPTNAKRLTAINCYAVAQEITKPFSIYPVEFRVELCDTEYAPLLRDVAVPVHELVVNLGNNTFQLLDEYIISCQMKPNIELCGGNSIRLYAKPLFPHVVALVAFCILKGE